MSRLDEQLIDEVVRATATSFAANGPSFSYSIDLPVAVASQLWTDAIIEREIMETVSRMSIRQRDARLRHVYRLVWIVLTFSRRSCMVV